MVFLAKNFSPDAHRSSPGPALSTRGNLARARARGAGSPRTVEHRYFPGLECYKTLFLGPHHQGLVAP